ncbi:hypothetical protein BJX63DRAFT_369920 [Aspergillus granulosus]|uniref:Uncharacterized protein n=1 Tax=Aspergillus granulosus TaxID=176169 RepID=A0ABR4H140_9EURO
MSSHQPNLRRCLGHQGVFNKCVTAAQEQTPRSHPEASSGGAHVTFAGLQRVSQEEGSTTYILFTSHLCQPVYSQVIFPGGGVNHIHPIHVPCPSVYIFSSHLMDRRRGQPRTCLFSTRFSPLTLACAGPATTKVAKTTA